MLRAAQIKSVDMVRTLLRKGNGQLILTYFLDRGYAAGGYCPWYETSTALWINKANLPLSHRGHGEVQSWKGMCIPQLLDMNKILTIYRILPSTSRKRFAILPRADRISNPIHQFDSRKGATWHCVVGRNFGSFVTHGLWILELYCW
jgi:Dynein light chain type 1.